jgi:hypothetical protein
MSPLAWSARPARECRDMGARICTALLLALTACGGASDSYRKAVEAKEAECRDDEDLGYHDLLAVCHRELSDLQARRARAEEEEHSAPSRAAAGFFNGLAGGNSPPQPQPVNCTSQVVGQFVYTNCR